MFAIEQGESDHPWGDGRSMTEAPMLHPSALVRASRLGAWTVVGPRCALLEVELREWSYAVRDVEIFNADVGKFCNVAAGVRINPTNHPMDRASQHHFTYRSRSHHLADADDPEVFAWRRARRVTIGPDVWIGHNAILLPGVSVGTGAAIGAGAVVTKDVPDYVIVAGNPARLIRPRFNPAQAERLKGIAWWDWSHARLKATLADFRALDIDSFVTKYTRPDVLAALPA